MKLYRMVSEELRWQKNHNRWTDRSKTQYPPVTRCVGYDNLLSRCNCCTGFVNYQTMAISMYMYWESNTLNVHHKFDLDLGPLVLKTCPENEYGSLTIKGLSLYPVTIKHRSQKMFSGQHFSWSSDRLTGAKEYTPFFK